MLKVKTYGSRKNLYEVKLLPNGKIQVEVGHSNKEVLKILKRYKNNPSGLLQFLPYKEKGDPRALYWLAVLISHYEDFFQKNKVVISFKEDVSLPPFRDKATSTKKEPPPPKFIKLVEKIEQLKESSAHAEREHEELVIDFFKTLGYEFPKDIKLGKERADILIEQKGTPFIVVEVKRDWNLKEKIHREQAYKYSLRQGGRYVIITNGNNYYIYDRTKGLTFQENYLGSFSLSPWSKGEEKLISLLEKMGK